VFGDYDNDGWPDLYVVNQGANTLFHNDGGAGFTDVTALANIGDEGKGSSASWGDFDEDGLLDLYVANFNCADCPNLDRDVLYRNLGDGTFEDVSEWLDGLGDDPVESTFVGSFVDYDNDGDLDIYVVIDHEVGNKLYRNDGAGCGGWCLTDVAETAGATGPVDGMGLAIGDYDNDGDLDLYFSDAVPAAMLLQNQTAQGSPTFVDVTSAAGLELASIGWGTVFFDYDNDGWLDLYLATTPSVPGLTNRLYRNLGDGTFADVSDGSGADDPGPTLGVASADYDRDGWVDLVIGNTSDRYALYRNLGHDDSHNWLAVRLEGLGSSNRDGIGGRVSLETSGGRTLMQEVKSGSSLGAGNEILVHFGLGIDDVSTATIVWPDGQVETFDEVAVNQLWTVRQTTLFSDGFESGDTSAWSHAVP
jgi:hypothetical protein